MLYHLSYSREQSAETVEPTVEIPLFAPNQARNPRVSAVENADYLGGIT